MVLPFLTIVPMALVHLLRTSDVEIGVVGLRIWDILLFAYIGRERGCWMLQGGV